MKQTKPVDIGTLSGLVQDVGKLAHQKVEGRPLDPGLALLRQWQSDRLARSHADISALPRYRPVMQFFLEDIYAPRDFTQRNHDMERMHDFLRRLAPEPIVRPLMLTVRLHQTTEHLDDRLLEVLVNQLGMTDSLTTPLYAEAYRRCDNYAERVAQIELIREIGLILDKVVHTPLSGPMLALAKGTLEHAGWMDVMSFMERGYKVFKQLPNTARLLDIIRQRELRILDRIYAGEHDPFEFPEV
ncbi:MAG: hypothetical protein WCF84_11685 [Anaerolineae bacterium]